MSKTGKAARAVTQALYPLDPGALIMLAFYAGMLVALIIGYVTSLEVEARQRRQADTTDALEADALEADALAHLASAMATPTPSGKRPLTAAHNGRAAQAQKVTIERGASATSSGAEGA